MSFPVFFPVHLGKISFSWVRFSCKRFLKLVHTFYKKMILVNFDEHGKLLLSLVISPNSRLHFQLFYLKGKIHSPYCEIILSLS